MIASLPAAAPAAIDPPAAKPGAATEPQAAQDRFLKLLVAQLNNQDPSNPLDNAQMTSQIAQINTVSGIEQVNRTLQALSAQFSALQVMQGSALIGRSVLSEGAGLSLADKTGKGGFELSAAATAVKVEILSAGGQVIDSIALGARSAGRHNFDWDASAYQGAGEALQFRVSALNGATPVDASPLSLSKISAAGADDGQLLLTLANGKTIRYAQIKALL